MKKTEQKALESNFPLNALSILDEANDANIKQIKEKAEKEAVKTPENYVYHAVKWFCDQELRRIKETGINEEVLLSGKNIPYLDPNYNYYVEVRDTVRALIDERKYTEAASLMERYPDKKSFVEELATVYFLLKDFKQSKYYYYELINQLKTHDDFYGHSRLGEICYKAGHYELSLKYYDKMTAFPPGIAKSHICCIRCCKKLGREKQAADYYGKYSEILDNMIKETPFSECLYRYKSELYNEMGFFNNAIKYANYALALTQKYKENFYLHRAKVYFEYAKSGKNNKQYLDNALSDALHAYILCKTQDAVLLIAKTYMMLKNFDKVLKVYEATAEEDFANSYFFHKEFAPILRKSGHFTKEQEALEKANASMNYYDAHRLIQETDISSLI